MAKSNLSTEAKAAIEQADKIRKELTAPTKKTPAKKLAVDEQAEELDGKDKGGTSEASTATTQDGVLKSEQTNLTETRSKDK